MAAANELPEPGRPAAAVSLQRLIPAGDQVGVAEAVEQMGLWQRTTEAPARPRVLLNMVSTADGRATFDGRSGGLSNSADRALFHGLRAAADCVLVGAGTVRTEHYGRLIGNSEIRRLRLARGLAEEPLACIVSGRLGLPVDLPLLGEPDARVAILTASAAALPPAQASVDYIRSAGGQLDLAAGLAELSGRFAVQTLLCEGGPHLARELLAGGLIDELMLTLSPLLAGGEPSGGEALRILAGAELEPPAKLELVGALSSDSSLFLRYSVGSAAPARVSRATTDSSSLAR